MNKKWVFVAVCVIALIVLCDAGDKNKKKSKQQLEKDKKKNEKTSSTVAETEAGKSNDDKMNAKTGNKKSKKGKREIPMANLMDYMETVSESKHQRK